MIYSEWMKKEDRLSHMTFLMPNNFRGLEITVAKFCMLERFIDFDGNWENLIRPGKLNSQFIVTTFSVLHAGGRSLFRFHIRYSVNKPQITGNKKPQIAGNNKPQITGNH